MRDWSLRLLVCGSVDDGKSTLIGRLLHDTGQILEDHLAAIEADSRIHGTTGGLDLALLTDGLSAEREQGITIDVAWRVLVTQSRRIHIADSPGHVQHTRNMATAASGCDAAVVLVDASRGVLPQTRRHVAIARLMGIRELVFAVNKLDLVEDPERRFAELSEDCRELGGADVTLHAIPVIARDGDNVVNPTARLAWWDGSTLLAALEDLDAGRADARIDAPLRFPVQLVLRSDSNFRGYAGTVASGTVRVGDEVRILPSGVLSRIARIATFDGDLPAAAAGSAVTLVLADDVDVVRGDLLILESEAPATRPLSGREVEATLVWLDQRPLSELRGLQLRAHTGTAPVRICDLRGELDVETGTERPVTDITPNAVVRAVVDVERDHVFDPYPRDRRTGAFVLIDRASGAVVAGGMCHALASPFDRTATGELTVRPSLVSPAARVARTGHAPATVVITGMTATGKSTLAQALERRLFALGATVVRLDGEALRLGVSRGLGFDPAERAEHLRRAAETARLLNDHGQLVILAAQAPSGAARSRMLTAIGPDRVLDVHLEAPSGVRRERDPDGVRREDTGGLAYEPPSEVDLRIDTSTTPIGPSVDTIVERLGARGILSPARVGARTVWLTGLSGSGKTTIAQALVDALAASGVPCELIDGDELRRTVSVDLGFSADDRTEQIRRAGQLALEAVGRGAVAVVALISPVRSARDAVRASHPPAGFVEVHVAAPLDVCEARDPKGLYARASAGEIERFTGIDSPYEAPVEPELVVDGTTAVDAAVDAVLSLLHDRSDRL